MGRHMTKQTIEGIVENGAIRLSGNVCLPEKTKVLVIVPDLRGDNAPRIESPRLAQSGQARNFRKQMIVGSPVDAGV
ncbi:MAG TPA: hypothetical protein VL992_06120 [Tepidisphaeraceae bacterium]|nr:hypothetical protein [Tepidisphaeraceae bacterium]